MQDVLPTVTEGLYVINLLPKIDWHRTVWEGGGRELAVLDILKSTKYVPRFTVGGQNALVILH